jgi:hypothetical protein
VRPDRIDETGASAESIRVITANRVSKCILSYLGKAFEEGNLRFHGKIAGLAEPVAFGARCHTRRLGAWLVKSGQTGAGCRRIEVVSNGRNLKVQARGGYYAR